MLISHQTSLIFCEISKSGQLQPGIKRAAFCIFNPKLRPLQSHIYQRGPPGPKGSPCSKSTGCQRKIKNKVCLVWSSRSRVREVRIEKGYREGGLLGGVFWPKIDQNFKTTHLKNIYDLIRILILVSDLSFKRVVYRESDFLRISSSPEGKSTLNSWSLFLRDYFCWVWEAFKTSSSKADLFS